MRKTFILIFLIGVLLMSCSKDQKVAVISTKFGDMVVEFFPDVAPKHVENFQILAEEGYYNGTTFHRVIPGFMVQGGDPNSKDLDRMNDGTGGRAGKFFGIGRENDPESWTVPAEFNDTPHQRGTLSMARSQNIDSGSSQFFICHDNAPFLDGQYTVFGQLISGIEVVDEIVNSERDPRDNPIDSCLLYTSPSPRDVEESRMPSSA